MELEKLVMKREALEKELVEVNKQINETEMTFEEWFEFAEKRDFEYLTYLRDASKPVYDYIKDVFEGNRYETYYLDEIFECVEDVPEEMQKELMKCNFGSVKWDW